MAIHESLIFTIKAQMDGALKQFNSMSNTVKEVQTDLEKFNQQRAKQDEATVRRLKNANYDKLFKPVLDNEKAMQQAAIETQKVVEKAAQEKTKAEQQSLQERQRALEKYNKDLEKYNQQRAQQDEATMRRLRQSQLEAAFPAQRSVPERLGIVKLSDRMPFLQQEIKATLEAEAAKQKAIEQTTRQTEAELKQTTRQTEAELKQRSQAEQRAAKQTEQATKQRLRVEQQAAKQRQSVMNKVGNFILPGFGGGLGMMAAQQAVKALQALKDTVGRGIEFNMMEDSAKMMYSVILKDGGKAVRLMEDLKQASLGSVLVYKDALVSAKQLLAYGFQDTQVVDTMKMLGDISAATGKNIQDLAYVYGTLRTQGKAYARDLTQFAMRGIPIYEELAKIFNTTSTALLQDVKRGKIDITFTDVEKAFKAMTGAGGVFEGAGTARVKTIEGQLTLLSEKFEIAVGSLTKNLEPAIVMLINFANTGVDAINGMAKAVEALDRAVKDATGVAEGQKALETAKKSIESGGDVRQILTSLLGNNKFYEQMQERYQQALSASGRRGFGVDGATGTRELLLNNAKTWVDVASQVATELKVPIDSVIAAMRSRMSYEQALWVQQALQNRKQDELSQRNAEALATATANLETMEYSTTGKLAQYIQAILQGQQVAIDNLFGKGERQVSPGVGYFARGLRRIDAPTSPDTIGAYEEAVLVANRRMESKTSSAGFEEFGNSVLMLWDSVQKATYTQFSRLADLIGDSRIATEAADEYQKALKVAIQATSEALVTGGAMGGKRQEVESFLKYLLGELDTVEASGRSGTNKKDPMIWEDLKVLQTYTQVDDLMRQQAKRLEEIKEAYKDVPGTTDKLNSSIDHTKTQFGRLINATKAYEASVNPQSMRDLAMQEYAAFAGGFTEQWAVNATKLNIQIAEANKKFAEEVAHYTNQTEIELLKEKHDWEIKLLNEKFEYEKGLAKSQEVLSGGNSKFWQDILSGAGNKIANAEEGIAGAKSQIAELGDLNRLSPEDTALLNSAQKTITTSSKQITKSVGDIIGANAMSGTQLGGTLSGGIGGDPLTQLAMAFVDALMQVENVAKTLNWADTIMKSAFEVLDYLFNHAFQPIVHILEYLGHVVGQIISPFIVVIDLVTTLAYLISSFVLTALGALGRAFEYISDYALIPFANGLIDITNGLIDGLNFFLKAISAKLIPRLEHILTSTERLEQEEKAKQAAKSMSLLAEGINYLKNKLKQEVDATVGSLRDLYEVGGISATEYEARSKEVMDQYNQFDDTLKNIKNSELSPILDINSIAGMVQSLTLMIDKLDTAKTLEEQAKDAGVELPPEYFDALDLTGLGKQLENIEINTRSTATGVNNLGQIVVNTYAIGDVTAMVDAMKAAWAAMPGGAGMGTSGGDAGAAEAYAPYITRLQGSESIAQETKDLVQALFDNKLWTPLRNVLYQLQEAWGYGPASHGGMNNLFAGLPQLATGTNYVPNDMIAQIHKGEMVIPKPYADDMRRGGNGDVNVTVVVQGSVQSENDLATTIANAIYRQRRSGVLTV
jgi:hypothetical protein